MLKDVSKYEFGYQDEMVGCCFQYFTRISSPSKGRNFTRVKITSFHCDDIVDVTFDVRFGPLTLRKVVRKVVVVKL